MSMGERMTWKKFYVVEWGRNKNMMFVEWGRNENMMFVWGKWSKIWFMKKIWKFVYLVFLELRFFSSMLPSMPKGEIISMNVDAIIMGEYCRTLIWCIHDCVCHWWQNKSKFVKFYRVADCDLCIDDNRLIIYWCVVVDVYYNMSWSWGSVCKTYINSLRNILMIYKK